MQRICIAVVIAVLAATSLGAHAITVRTGVGKVRIFLPKGVSSSTIKFGRADGGTFDGCTTDAGFVTNARAVSTPLIAELDPPSVLAMLLSAKQTKSEVTVVYLVDSNGRCILRSLDVN